MPLTARLDRLLAGRVGSRPVGILRVAIGAAALLKALNLWGPVARTTQPAFLDLPHFGWVPHPPAGLVPLLMGLWILAALAFTVGFRTRAAGSLLTAILVYVLLLDQQLYSNHLYLLAILVFLLTLADAGACASVDAIGRGTRERVPGWPVLLLKLQISIVYGYAVIAKLNASFVSGSVLATHLRPDGPLTVPAPLVTFPVMYALSLVALFTEGFLAVALWLPRARRSAFAVGLALHLGMVVMLSPPFELTIFALETLALYILFVDASVASRIVVWDDSCTFCGGWVRWFRRLDWLAAHRFLGLSDPEAYRATGVSREEAAGALQLVSAEGRASGFDAVRGVLETLPASFLWAPYLAIPPIRKMGRRAYRAVARRRRCPITAGAAHPAHEPAIIRSP